MIRLIILIFLLNTGNYSQNKDSININSVFRDTVLKIVEIKTIRDTNYRESQLDSMKLMITKLTDKIENKGLEVWVPLVAYLLAGLISLVVALLTIRANVISKARIKWIQDLRDTMSEFLSLSESIAEHKINQDKDENIKNVHISHIARMRSRESKLKLLLNNVNEGVQKELVTIIGKYRDEINHYALGVDDKNLKALKEDCINKTQYILKTEWDVAKKESQMFLFFQNKKTQK